jgi:hypothetical protein
VSSTSLRYSVSQQRRIHILDGDSTGGGHRSGAGKGKSEFPATWSDDQIVSAIEDVANNLSLTQTLVGFSRFGVVGFVNGLRIKVYADYRSFEIVTGFRY